MFTAKSIAHSVRSCSTKRASTSLWNTRPLSRFTPGIVTEPHNHNCWAVIGIYQGREDNLLWARDGDGIKPIGALTLAAGDTHAMSADDIHTAFNPSQSLTGAIHIYEGDFLTTPKREWDPVTHEERPRIMAETFARFDE